MRTPPRRPSPWPFRSVTLGDLSRGLPFPPPPSVAPVEPWTPQQPDGPLGRPGAGGRDAVFREAAQENGVSEPGPAVSQVTGTAWSWGVGAELRFPPPRPSLGNSLGQRPGRFLLIFPRLRVPKPQGDQDSLDETHRVTGHCPAHSQRWNDRSRRAQESRVPRAPPPAWRAEPALDSPFLQAVVGGTKGSPLDADGIH